MKQKRLLITMGLPRSGKSCWAKTQSYPIVNPDSIRLALHGQRFEQLAEPFVWAIAQVMVRSLFRAGHDIVILDATNTTKKRREVWTSEDWDRVFVDGFAPKETCLERAHEELDAEMLLVIERMADQWEDLQEDETGYIVSYQDVKKGSDPHQQQSLGKLGDLVKQFMPKPEDKEPEEG